MVLSGLQMSGAGADPALASPATQGAAVHQHQGRDGSAALSLLSMTSEDLGFILPLWLPEVWTQHGSFVTWPV